jgi:hypothetical protein
MRKSVLACGLVLSIAAVPSSLFAQEENAAASRDSRSDLESAPRDLTTTTEVDVPRTIGRLSWHTSYSAAYRKARDERRMLFLLFRDDAKPRVADAYESNVLAQQDLEGPLSEVVRVVLPLNAKRPLQNPEKPDLTLLGDAAFKYMYGRQGIAMIDLTDPESPHFGQVVSAHPFSPGLHYTVRGTRTVLGLPQGTVTQRALVYAVLMHPAAPISTTDGKCHGYLCQMARQSSRLMANYGSVGHHDWGTRYSEIASKTGKSAQEVAAMSGNPTLVDAAVEVVNQWYGSPAHWSIMSTPASIYGYDFVRAPGGGWYGTGIFAN